MTGATAYEIHTDDQIRTGNEVAGRAISKASRPASRKDEAYSAPLDETILTTIFAQAGNADARRSTHMTSYCQPFRRRVDYLRHPAG
jgi:hypothetical protein|eukprot:7380976-Prymnesium_polylepis.1